MKVFACLFFLNLLIFSCFAQLTSLKGKVFNDKNEPIAGALVSINNTNIKVTSNNIGEYIINNLTTTNFTLNVNAIGYRFFQKKVKIKTNEKNEIDILLESKVTELETVNVFTKINAEEELTARNTEKKANNIVNIISAKAMERSPDINAANVLQRVSGVTLQKNSGADEAYAIVRGLEPRYNNTLINGVKIASPDEKSRFVSLNIIPSDLLQKIEVSKTLIPEMEGDAIGGTVNLVLKDAPDSLLIKATASIGYGNVFFKNKFTSFSKKNIEQKNLSERFGTDYVAKQSDFSRSNLDFKDATSLPNGTIGFTYGKRFLHNKLGLLLAENFQNIFYRVSSENANVQPSPTLNEPFITNQVNRNICTQQLNNGITAHIDYNFNKRNKIIVTNIFLYNYLAQARSSVDTAFVGGNGGRTVLGTGPVTNNYTSITNTQFVNNLKLEGKHIFSKYLFFDWAGVLSIAGQATPDRANLNINKKIDTLHTTNDINGPYIFSSTPYFLNSLSRIWQRNSDKDYNILANIAYRPSIKKMFLEIKAGVLYRNKSRYNLQNEYDLKAAANANGSKQVFLDINSAQWVVYNTSGTQLFDINNYKVFENVSAAYTQLKLSFKKIDVFGGLRVEKTEQGFTLNTFYLTGINALNKSYSDVLPSVMMKYKLNKKTNIRVSYFKSISRPNYYELVPTRQSSNTTADEIEGNPNLVHTVADNFDIRYEIYPKEEEQLFIGGFYKKIKNPIEYTYKDLSTLTPQNLGIATVYGAELVFTKYFGKFGVTGNYTYVFSQIESPKKFTDVVLGTATILKMQQRPMQGQTDHSVNISLLYKNEAKKIFAQLAYQYIGNTLSRVYDTYGYDYYQKPQSFLSLSAEKQILNKHLTAFGKMNNILNTANINKINNLQVLSETYGANFSIGLRYSK